MEDTQDIINFYRESSNDALFKQADEVCRSTFGNKVYIRGLVEFSNICNKDCLYCGIRHSNKKVVRYRVPDETLFAIIKEGYNKGLRTFVLQSGEDPHYTTDKLMYILDTIKKITNNEAAITLSNGIRSKKDFKLLKKYGAARYLMRFETSDPFLHKNLRNGISLQKRLDALNNLRELDYEVGSGYMVGLPDETEKTRINNALLCKKLKLDMVGIGPFIPHPDTPLANSKKHTIELAMRATSLVRLLLPKANIPATTAAGSIDPLGREKILSCGANVLMPNITPTDVKKYYLLYPGKICLDESGIECISCLNGRVNSIGKELSLARGDSPYKLDREKLSV